MVLVVDFPRLQHMVLSSDHFDLQLPVFVDVDPFDFHQQIVTFEYFFRLRKILQLGWLHLLSGDKRSPSVP